MKKQMTIAYDVHSGLYLNLTNRCPCACTFCLRQTMDSVGNSGGLWLEHEPSYEEVIAAIDSCNPDKYTEVVFCGFGEPTERLDISRKTGRIKKSVSIPMVWVIWFVENRLRKS